MKKMNYLLRRHVNLWTSPKILKHSNAEQVATVELIYEKFK